MFSLRRNPVAALAGLAIACFCVLFALVPAGAQAGELTLTPRNQLARAGEMLKLRLTAEAAGSCRLRVDGRRLTITTPVAGRFVIRGRVSPRARPGAHALSLRCSAGHTRARVRVARRAGNRNARGTLFRGRVRISATQQTLTPSVPTATPIATPTTPFARPILPVSAQAHQWWQNYGGAVVASFRNGQCTDWAQRRRPDIVQNGYMRRYDLLGPDNVVTSWDAKYWTQHAVDAGIAVARRPVVGAIMVSAPGSYGAGSSGHVSVVEAVAADGSFAATSMHAPEVGKVTWQTYGSGTASAMATSPGIAFIL